MNIIQKVKKVLNTLTKLKDFDDYYINTNGELYRLVKINPCDTVYGYHEYALRKNNKVYRRKAHRLVAEAYLDNPNNYDTVHHKDHNRLNNSVDNLEWSKNSDHVRGHRGQSITIDGIEYPSMREASKQTGIARNRLFKKAV